jgi:hypothetical protein
MWTKIHMILRYIECGFASCGYCVSTIFYLCPGWLTAIFGFKKCVLKYIYTEENVGFCITWCRVAKGRALQHHLKSLLYFQTISAAYLHIFLSFIHKESTYTFTFSCVAVVLTTCPFTRPYHNQPVLFKCNPCFLLPTRVHKGKMHEYKFCQTQHFCATFCGNILPSKRPFHATSTNQPTNKQKC